MIGKVFQTESKRVLNCVVAMSAGLALLLLVGAIIARCLSGETALLLAKSAYALLLALSYGGPCLVILAVIYGEKLNYFEMAGVPRDKMTAGRILTVFVWTTALILAELLAATVFDAICFAGRTTLRNQLPQSYFLFSLISHGAGRLLFAPSVAVTGVLLYITYDFIKWLITGPSKNRAKLLWTAISVIVILLYQWWGGVLVAVCLPIDLNFVLTWDTLFPVQSPYWLFAPTDIVKDYHTFAAPIFNLCFLVVQGVYVTIWICAKKLFWRRKNEI